jgi:hypothetical protein
MRFLLLILLFVGCSKPKYLVVSSFNEVVLETYNKDLAEKSAKEFTSKDRVLASKPEYIVVEQ